MTRFQEAWLTLREPADAAARSVSLLDELVARLPEGGLVIRDLGCGTGSMARWLSRRLPRPQQWILTDRDQELLARATASVPHAITDLRDLTSLTAADLTGTSLVTGSALLDLFTADEVSALAAACARAGCPVLFALSVTGRVELEPADPLDEELEAAFNAHQRRTTGGRRLLGPDAVAAATLAFRTLGMAVHRAPSPWRLGPGQAALVEQWLDGWLSAAVEQRPGLAAHADAYRERRLTANAGDGLRVTVHHEDLLALP